VGVGEGGGSGGEEAGEEGVALEEVLLVVVLSVVEVRRGKDLGGDWAPVITRCGLLRCDGQRLLPFVVVEDGRHVLSGALRGGVVVVPEHLEESVVVRLLGVELHFDGLRVVTEGVVGGAGPGAPRVAHFGADHPGGGPELGLGEPESGHPEGGPLGGDFWFEELHRCGMRCLSRRREDSK